MGIQKQQLHLKKYRINDDINITLENANDAYYNSISKIMED